MNYLLGGALLYGLVVSGLYVFQGRMIFPRGAALRAFYPLPDGNERLVLKTDGGYALHGNLVRAPGRSRGLLIGFTGNAWNADDCMSFMAHRFRDVDIVVFHYRGYAPSEGVPSEAALFEDAVLVYDRMTAGLKPARVFLMGFSLGSGVAAYLASRRPVAGQVLVTPFDSIEAVAANRYFFVPVRHLLKHPFRSIEHLRQVDTPTAIVAASHDSVVPRARTDALVAALKRPVLVESVPESTHGGIYDTEVVGDVLRRALDRVEAAAMGGPGATVDRPSGRGRDEGAAAQPA
ncbi:MAG: hypothetical protein KDG89_09370 [Geminicoccaceae bacterium]|nr:hypothetical protein [Geminicoccaceae bacterium]